MLGTLDLSKTELVISTIPDAQTNLVIHRSIKAKNPNAIVLVIAHCVADALGHYDDGVDYVMLPHFLGGRHADDLVMKFGSDRSKYDELREQHIEHLQLRIAIGHDHPAQSANKKV